MEWIKTIGWGAFFFFLGKGMLWLLLFFLVAKGIISREKMEQIKQRLSFRRKKSENPRVP
jgi:hypothetical protein